MANWVGDFAKGLIEPVTNLISEFVTDKDKVNELAFRVSTMAAEHSHARVMAQLAINQQEAAHKSVFVAGWRPAVGWVCVTGLALTYIVFPLSVYVTALFDVKTEAPAMDMVMLMTLLSGMLGLGTLRTYEKVKGVAREN